MKAILFEPAGDEYLFQLQIAGANGQGYIIKGQIDGEGSFTIESREPTIASCPICLAVQTMIDTPDCAVAVEDLQAGDLIWTADAVGMRQLAVVLKTTSTIVPMDHHILRVMLDDGRGLQASPGHPLPGGLTLQDSQQGDPLDGAIVTVLEEVLYTHLMMYDLLPSGITGFYWANGILTGITLAGK